MFFSVEVKRLRDNDSSPCGHGRQFHADSTRSPASYGFAVYSTSIVLVQDGICWVLIMFSKLLSCLFHQPYLISSKCKRKSKKMILLVLPSCQLTSLKSCCWQATEPDVGQSWSCCPEWFSLPHTDSMVRAGLNSLCPALLPSTTLLPGGHQPARLSV